ncbi:hypothetical protein [[Mycoplasma] testudinis]|uniref:hypothetical protein n=1 Tax=[Mycoplasma] testudinis TaxID=33924 RepID=UPI0004806F6A|nr:hypothetical protein [[Mycoplasma] testudinis]
MAYKFKEPIDFLYLFCKNCWEFRKFSIDKKIDFNSKVDLDKIDTYECTVCNTPTEIVRKEIVDYYQKLLEDEDDSKSGW